MVGISNTEVKNLCALYLSHLTKRGGFVKINYFFKAAASECGSPSGCIELCIFFAQPISYYVSQIYIVTVDNYKLFITLIATP